MNTDIDLMAPGRPGVERRLLRAERWLHAYERRLSRFLPTSELSRLNASREERVVVSPLLFRLLQASIAFACRSGGRFDPTVLDALEAAGYDRSYELLTTPALASPSRTPFGSYRDVRLGVGTRSVVRPPGLRLDLGGIGKGWAVDRTAAIIGPPALVNAGGDIYAAGAPPDAPAWLVGVEDPFAPERDLALLAVSDRGIATSSVLRRRWRSAGGPERHHIIDPRVGAPADTDAVAVTVVAPTAVLADYHAKMALITGVAGGFAYLRREPDVEGMIVGHGGELVTTPGIERLLVRS
jgi:thiamine biosynthesis lipoprotein